MAFTPLIETCMNGTCNTVFNKGCRTIHLFLFNSEGEIKIQDKASGQ